MVAPRKLILMALSSLSLCGCAASLQDIHYAAVNKTRAEYAWYSSTSISDRWNCGSDYAYGYKSGYYDKATGKACTLPAVPPPCYWSTKYQCCEGQKHIQDWYRGYQCGVAAAEGSGYPYFHDVPIGPQAPVINKDGCGACYAPTDCLCGDDVTGSPSAIASPVSTQLPSSPSELAATTAQPVFQASAVSGQFQVPPQYTMVQPRLGMIGPSGAAESTPKSNATRPEVMTAGLIGPVGPVESKTKVGIERQTATADAAAQQRVTR